MTIGSGLDTPRPLVLNLDVVVRGALCASALGLATTTILLEAIYILIAVNADNAALKELGITHQAYAVVGAITFAVVFDAVFLPVMFFAARAYLRSHWKMALFSAAVWTAQVALTVHQWKSLADPWATVPSDLIGALLFGYLAIRWSHMKAQE